MEPLGEKMALLSSETIEKKEFLDRSIKTNNGNCQHLGKLRTYRKNHKKEIALMDTKIQKQNKHVLEMQQNITHIMEQYNGEKQKKEGYHKLKVRLMALLKVYDVLNTNNISSTKNEIVGSTAKHVSPLSSYEEVVRKNELLEKNRNKARIALNKLHSKHNIEKNKLNREYKLLSNVSILIITVFNFSYLIIRKDGQIDI